MKQPIITASIIREFASRSGAMAFVEDVLARGLAVSMIRQGYTYTVRAMDGRGL